MVVDWDSLRFVTVSRLRLEKTMVLHSVREHAQNWHGLACYVVASYQTK